VALDKQTKFAEPLTNQGKDYSDVVCNRRRDLDVITRKGGSSLQEERVGPAVYEPAGKTTCTEFSRVKGLVARSIVCSARWAKERKEKCGIHPWGWCNFRKNLLLVGLKRNRTVPRGEGGGIF